MDRRLVLLAATAAVLALLISLAPVADAGVVYCPRCPNRGLVYCPRECSKRCAVHCDTCRADCGRCDRRGAVCQDPRFVGADGVTFYFHGRKDADFCLVTDSNLHINAHFIGKSRPGSRDFTWIQALGIVLPGGRSLQIGARKVGVWDASEDQLFALWGEAREEVDLQQVSGAAWESADGAVRLQRLAPVNELLVEVPGVLRIAASVVPVTAEESRVHGYGIDATDCFAHLELNFDFFNLSSSVHGVLGQTYAPGFVNPVDSSLPMPIMGGEPSFTSSSLVAPDCKVSRFTSLPPVDGAMIKLPSMSCASGGSAGVTCAR